MASLNLDHLDTFRLVISRGSFSGAADVLGLSQPAVSLQIRQLEQSLQTRLIERTGRGVRATAAGLALLEHGEHIASAIAAALAAVTQQAEEISGTVIIGTGATACIHLLPPLLQQLRQQHPQLKVDVRTGNTAAIIRAVEENQVDIGLVTLPVASQSVHVSALYDEKFRLIMARDSAAAVEPAELAPLPLIVFEPGSGTRAVIDGWFREAGVRATPVMELGSIEAIKRMVRAGLGYSLVPAMALAQPEDRAGLCVLEPQPALQRTLGTVMRQDRIVNRGMTAVLELLRHACTGP
ncbi:MAG: LysR family transcriptional regulator [Pantoea sp.]|uniref:LysR family transcriptional regulator n=1 Tax=Pantoea phytobeneficialis TaxID=2052056 RepID=A0AAP9H9H1_9GAMM|nr:LysR family transcriptional regulator [Pantoea phytobeneficialis]MDO6407155.1 LysR family transcriptional regulator [Pantoea phytobeneficialis]QGR09128.1 LysR family transcriptional regulator [Pantoea phytobeneficialis]